MKTQTRDMGHLFHIVTDTDSCIENKLLPVIKNRKGVLLVLSFWWNVWQIRQKDGYFLKGFSLKFARIRLFKEVEKIKGRDNQRVTNASFADKPGNILDRMKAYFQFLRFVQF